ncbi:hypothetical protein VXS06_14370 [Photobacterium toruni]|uniref:Uncharacterized protein n=1 Tax=Photobacterium toruni TaxID=1935446 RepID=A0ABU6LCB5_9GAMM|nr:hypothetical protein [Photobacterium toruni]
MSEVKRTTLIEAVGELTHEATGLLQQYRDIHLLLSNITVKSQILSEGSLPTVNYDRAENSMVFGLPKGVIGGFSNKPFAPVNMRSAEYQFLKGIERFKVTKVNAVPTFTRNTLAWFALKEYQANEARFITDLDGNECLLVEICSTNKALVSEAIISKQTKDTYALPAGIASTKAYKASMSIYVTGIDGKGSFRSYFGYAATWSQQAILNVLPGISSYGSVDRDWDKMPGNDITNCNFCDFDSRSDDFRAKIRGQIEESPHPTSYIPTTGTAVTRGEDLVVFKNKSDVELLSESGDIVYPVSCEGGFKLAPGLYYGFNKEDFI